MTQQSGYTITTTVEATWTILYNSKFIECVGSISFFNYDHLSTKYITSLVQQNIEENL